jgi:DNA-binding transcriptional regulator YhcF (GntR family)
MARDQVAGAIILDTLRERIVSGLYVGHWRPGERLPSIREIADAEGVDRKTAAAAYHRLEQEGLVHVRPRSGVYLSAPPPPTPAGPLERLHRQWLQHTFESARALGLDTRTILRLTNEVSVLEQVRLPVIECSWPQAETIAEELRDRLEIQAMPYLLEELRPGDPLLADAPILVTTSYHVSELGLLAPGRVVVEVTLAPSILRELRARGDAERILVITCDDTQAEKVRRALRHLRAGNLNTVPATDRSSLLTAAQQADAAFLWPGAPRWVEEALPPSLKRLRPRRTISDESVARIQSALLDAALRRVRETSRSTGAVAPR